MICAHKTKRTENCAVIVGLGEMQSDFIMSTFIVNELCKIVATAMKEEENLIDSCDDNKSLCAIASATIIIFI